MIVDAHLDIAYNATRGRDPRMRAADQPPIEGEIATVGLPDLRDGGVKLVCATIFCEPAGPGAKAGYTDAEQARAQALAQRDWYRARVDEGLMRMARRAEDLPRDTGFQPVPGAPETSASSHSGDITGEHRSTGFQPVPGAPGLGESSDTAAASHGLEARATFILLLEGADAIRTPDDLPEWFDAGLRMVGLAWKQTRYAGGTGAPGPLTADGRRLVKELDRFGIIHDTSHLAEQSFWDLLDLTDRPVVASHSNCRSIVGGGDRHLTDDMIRAIAKRGGVIGINFFDRFLLPREQYGKRRATLADVVAHIKHICDLTGSAKHVGIGTDMDGGLGREQIPAEIQTSADLPRVAEAISAAGFSDGDVNGIMAGNWVAFLAEALARLPGKKEC